MNKSNTMYNTNLYVKNAMCALKDACLAKLSTLNMITDLKEKILNRVVICAIGLYYYNVSTVIAIYDLHILMCKVNHMKKKEKKKKKRNTNLQNSLFEKISLN